MLRAVDLFALSIDRAAPSRDLLLAILERNGQTDRIAISVSRVSVLIAIKTGYHMIYKRNLG